jgi:hypothetical protein
VVGSGGRTTVSGGQLEQAFGLMSTYASFTTITTRGVNSTGGPSAPAAPSSGSASGGTGVTGPAGAATGSGGATFGNAFRAAPRRMTSPELSGTIFPGRRGELVTVQRRGAHGFTGVRRVRLGAGGRYRIALGLPGRYRIVSAGFTGPAIALH